MTPNVEPDGVFLAPSWLQLTPACHQVVTGGSTHGKFPCSIWSKNGDKSGDNSGDRAKEGGAKNSEVLCKKYGKYGDLEKMVEPLGSRWSMKAN